jgi:G:T-mismatch repair DNA endonuclease (very short patch repair protein)
MKCLECGRDVRNINFKHLKSCCGLTPEEYRKRHPGAELVDPEVKRSYGLPLERNPNWKGGRSYRNCKHCGKRISRNNTSDRCRKCALSGENNPFFGQRHSDETRTRMKLSAKFRDRSTYFPKKPTSEELSRARRNYWRRIPPPERASHLTSFIIAGQKHNKKSSKTKIENIVADILSDIGLTYQRNIQIGRYNVDFLVEEETIIECFGDYWHCNPILYSTDYYHPALHVTATERWLRDRKRLEVLMGLGFTCYVLWEHDIEHAQAEIRATLVTAFSCKMEDDHAMD